jgi:hypothetical protein
MVEENYQEKVEVRDHASTWSAYAQYNVEELLTFLLVEVGVASAGRYIGSAYALYIQSIQNELTRWKRVPNNKAKAASSRLKVLAEHMQGTC